MLRTKLWSASISPGGEWDVERMFNRFGKNRSGFIDYDELHMMVRSVMPAELHRWRLIESAMDPSGKGSGETSVIHVLGTRRHDPPCSVYAAACVRDEKLSTVIALLNAYKLRPWTGELRPPLTSLLGFLTQA